MKYIISGKVIRGDGYGRQIGFPTLNLKLDIKKDSKLKDGVYAGEAIFNKKTYKAGIIIGPEDKIEAHLIKYAGNAYGKKVTLKISKFLRKYKKFNTEEKLIIQIKKDLSKC